MSDSPNTGIFHRMNKFLSFLIIFLLLNLLVISSTFACPGKNGIPDYNCDGVVKIFFIGDSFVYGYGDTVNDNKGGYVLRLESELPDVTVKSYGIQGLRALTLVSTVNKTFTKSNPYPLFRKNLEEADVIILDIGRNDRWYRGLASTTYRNLDRITKTIASNILELTGYEPLVIKSNLMIPNRGTQAPWVEGLNHLILTKSTDRFPGDIRFDLISKKLISSDNIHPTSAGYSAIAKAFKAYFPKLKKHFQMNRPDTDRDGISDIFETNKFFTNPASVDTDSDGKTDTDEIFKFKTDPLVAD